MEVMTAPLGEFLREGLLWFNIFSQAQTLLAPNNFGRMRIVCSPLIRSCALH